MPDIDYNQIGTYLVVLSALIWLISRIIIDSKR